MHEIERRLTCPLRELFRTVGLKTNQRKRWLQRLADAQRFMKFRAKNKKLLIEIAAQHPLNGIQPGLEFQARLDRGIQLYKEWKKKGFDVEIYVPGSLHMHNGVQDKISLSQAGVNYLLEKAIPPKFVHGEDLNNIYKGEGATHKGVYCSGDECKVASDAFKTGGFGLLFSVLSPRQAQRKQVHYVANGVVPKIYPVSTPQFFHKAKIEAFESVPEVLRASDPTFQAADCQPAIRFRESRMPGYCLH